jgi:hypothetical protein
VMSTLSGVKSKGMDSAIFESENEEGAGEDGVGYDRGRG